VIPVFFKAVVPFDVSVPDVVRAARVEAPVTVTAPPKVQALAAVQVIL
jgi:hypothetical protein